VLHLIDSKFINIHVTHLLYKVFLKDASTLWVSPCSRR